MARHEPVDVNAAAPSERRRRDTEAPADRYASAKPVIPSRKGFSATGLAVGAVGVALLGVAIWAIFASLDQPGLGLLFMLPVLVGAGLLYALSIRRRLRDAVVDELAAALATHIGVPDPSYLEIDARQWQGGWVGVPHVLNIRYPDEVDDSAPDWPGDVAEAVHAELGEQYVVGRHNIRARRLTLRDPKRASGQLTAEPVSRDRRAVRQGLPGKIARPVPSQEDLSTWLVPLGVDASGTRVAWNLGASQGHLLALGRSGSGKRVLLTGVVVEVAARGWPVWIIDHRRVDLLGVRDWPNVQIVASTLDDQIVVLNQAWREMEGRVALVESGSSPSELEPLVVVVHHFREFAAAVADAADRAGQSASSSLALDRITELLRHGRQVNVFVVLSAQRADDPLLRQENRDELAAVVALGRLDSGAASTLWGADGAEELSEPVPGRATLQLGDSPPVQAQCYWTPDPREARRIGDEQDLYLLDALRPNVVTHPVLHVQRPRALADSPAAAWKANLAAELAEGYAARATRLVDWSRARSSASSGSAGTASKDTSGWSEIVMVSQLQPGNLARLDDDTGWVIVEQVDAVENDGTRIRIHWRGSEGTGSVVVSRTRTVRIRHMNDGVY